MGIFYLEFSKEISEESRLSVSTSYSLKDSFSYNSGKIYFASLMPDAHPEAVILQNENRLIFVHGHCSNLTMDNYREIDSLFGNFNIIVIHKNEDKIEFYKDYTNSFDTFFFEGPKRLIITNNPLLIPNKGLTIDYSSIAQYFLHFSGLFASNYFFKEIKRLEGGVALTINSDGSSHIVVRKPVLNTPTDSSFHTSFGRTITGALGKNPSEIYGADLTGGYDTRLIAACLLNKNIKFKGVVHGDDDYEVKYVRKMAETLNLPLAVIPISGEIPNILKDWKEYFFLSGGYYNFFETLKEGARSKQRLKYTNTKIGGGGGQLLRDRWYVNLFHQSHLNDRNLCDTLVSKLLKMQEPFKYCTKNFISEHLLKYRDILTERANKHIGSNQNMDTAQKFMSFMFENYTKGWLGCLYNFHNNIVTLVAPYMDNHFFLNCFSVDAKFQRNASGMTNAINKFHRQFEEIPFIEGHKCVEVTGVNLMRFSINNLAYHFRHRFFSYIRKSEYDHATWFNTLLKDDEFKSFILKPNYELDKIIAPEKFQQLSQLALNNSLNRQQFDFLWKLISLKLTFVTNIDDF